MVERRAEENACRSEAVGWTGSVGPRDETQQSRLACEPQLASHPGPYDNFCHDSLR